MITPAIASEPYCAAAPSVSTSTRSTAEIGISPRSAAEEPRVAPPLLLIIEVPWRRLPLTSTSTWLPDKPRSDEPPTFFDRAPPLLLMLM
ncbi:hypothetical protein D3C72_1656730 [compost metagenome]